LTLTIVNTLEEKTWREFVYHHPQGNIFHTPEMFQVFSGAKGYKPNLWGVVDESKHPLALLLPVQVSLQKGLFYHWTTRAVAYGSLLCATGFERNEELKSLLQTYCHMMRGRILFTELRNLSNLSNLQPVLNTCSYTYEDHMNYLIDLNQSEEALWHNIDRTGRKYVRASTNHGTVVEQVTSREQFTIAYQILQNTYNRIHVPIPHISLFESAYKILSPKKMFHIFLAYAEGNYIGTKFILSYKGKIIAWYGGSDRAFNSHRPNEYLTWYVLQWSKRQGYHEFDFGGAGKPNEVYGPRDFKAKFGGKLVNFGRNTCIHSPRRLQISKNVYSWLRKVSFFRSPHLRKQDSIEY